jgi:GAF domain-containing protein
MIGTKSLSAASAPIHELEHAQRFASREALRIRRRKILADMAARLLAGEDVDTEVMPALYRALSAERIIDATLGFVVVDLDHPMKLGFMEGFSAEMIQRCLTLDFGQAICGTVALTRQPMHVTDIQRSFDPIADLVRSAGINAYACEPLIAGDRILGTLSFATRSRRSFDADDLIFFRQIAKHIVRARARARKRGKRAGREQA